MIPLDVLSLQVKSALKSCPAGCAHPWTVYAMPKPFPAEPIQVRCLTCLSYWEVTAGGEILHVRNVPHAFAAIHDGLDAVGHQLREMSKELTETGHSLARTAAMMDEYLKKQSSKQGEG